MRNGMVRPVISVPVTDRTVEYRVKAEAPNRQIRVTRDNAALATFVES